MARVTKQEVLEIIDTDIENIEPFILAATGLVDAKLVGSGLVTAQLKEIERWLAAHFTAIREDGARVVEEEEGESRRRFGENTRGVLGQQLLLTRYGQQAVALDTSGILTDLNNSGVARLTVV